MTFPIRVERDNGRFVAQLIGAPEVSASGASQSSAIDALREVVSKQLEQGRLATIDVSPVSVTSLFGTFSDDPTLLEISEEAYRRRDSEVAG